MRIYGKLFKFSITEQDYDGTFQDQIVGVHATGYTEALEYLRSLTQFVGANFIGEIE
jgi:hypothetical protein